MAPFPPPDRLTGTPSRYVVPAGTVLWRIHHESTAADGFDKPQHRVFGGGRFDGTVTAPYNYLYASPDPDTAVAERFLPEFANIPMGDRILLGRRAAGQRLSALRTVRDLTLLRLVSAPDLAAVDQDSWLTTADGREYPRTREWAAALRELVPWAQGFIWTSDADVPRTTMILFEDRCVDTPLLTDHGMSRPADSPTDSPTGTSNWLAEILARYGVRTSPPPMRQAKVFINYRATECEHPALLLHNELSRRFGERAVFRAGASIPLGIPFAQVLLFNARNSQVMLSLVGRAWEHAMDKDGNLLLSDPEDWVRREILEAFAHDVAVAPVIVGVRPRLSADNLPAELSMLTSLQFLQLPRDADDTDARSLVNKLLRRFPDLNEGRDLI